VACDVFTQDDHRGLNSEQAAKLARILAFLNRAARPEDMNLPGFKLHALKGNLSGYWSVTVRANWRLFFGSRMATSATLT